MPADEAKLYSTTNASIWAAEWVKVARELQAEGKDVIDEGWMIGWFANAIETAKDVGFQEGKDAEFQANQDSRAMDEW